MPTDYFLLLFSLPISFSTMSLSFLRDRDFLRSMLALAVPVLALRYRRDDPRIATCLIAAGLLGIAWMVLEAVRIFQDINFQA